MNHLVVYYLHNRGRLNRVILPRRFSPYITRIKPFMENKN